MSRGKYLTEEQKSEIVRLTKEGYTQAEIADRVGVSRNSIWRIQKKNCLKASNRWRFGESCEYDKKAPVKKTVAQIVERNDTPGSQWIKVAKKAIKISGQKTGFEYELRFDETYIQVNPGYDEPFKIDLKDIVSFGNELLAVADELLEMKKNVSGV